ncbi:DNA-binding protein [Nocardioides sp. GCM10027113]|uniref:plasmid mobilization protein n=1 Tax=unclassified Nocardioides TaxID=2615069 RepID=UPI003611C4A2
MAMTLRLTEEETAELREAAERAGKSMQAFARDAVLEAARGRSKRREAAMRRILEERGDLLDRLGNA